MKVEERNRRSEAVAARRRMLEGLPLTESRLDIEGTTTAVLEGGQGEPLVLLHGGITCGGICWTPVVRQLSERHRLIIPDLPGLGESEPAERLDAATFASWLAALVGQTCEGAATVVAHSLVGSLTARFAAGHGHLLRRLVICGAPGIGPFRPPMGLMRASMRLDLRPTLANLKRLQAWPFLDIGHTSKRDPAWFDAFDNYLLERGAQRSVKRTMRQLLFAGKKQIPDGELRRIEVPTTLVWGRHDRMTPLSLGQGASRNLGWALRVIEDAGHIPHVEQPDQFVSAVLETEPR